MAKRKTAKQEKVVDLKPRVDKISEEDLQNLQKLASQFDLYHQEVGVLESRKHNFLQIINQLQGQMKTLQDDFKERYGDIDIDIRTGDIKQPIENGQVNS